MRRYKMKVLWRAGAISEGTAYSPPPDAEVRVGNLAYVGSVSVTPKTAPPAVGEAKATICSVFCRFSITIFKKCSHLASVSLRSIDKVGFFPSLDCSIVITIQSLY